MFMSVFCVLSPAPHEASLTWAFNHLHRWEHSEAGGWPGLPVYRPVHSGPRTRDSSSHSFGGLGPFFIVRNVCCDIFVNGRLIFTIDAGFSLGVWLPCALAWGETVDCSAKEPGATGPRCHFGQPHGYVSPCIFPSAVSSILRTHISP